MCVRGDAAVVQVAVSLVACPVGKCPPPCWQQSKRRGGYLGNPRLGEDEDGDDHDDDAADGGSSFEKADAETLANRKRVKARSSGGEDIAARSAAALPTTGGVFNGFSLLPTGGANTGVSALSALGALASSSGAA